MLRRNSFGVYTKMLARLLEAQRDFKFLQPLSDALRQKQWPEVYRLADSLSVQQYPDATSHFVANQFTLLIKKYPWDSKLVELDPEKTAIDSFFKSERRCGRINKKFEMLMNDPSRDVFRAEGKVAMAWIRSVIGTTPSYSAIARECDFGQGASVGVHGDATHVLRKLSSEQKWTVTPGAIHHGFAGMLNNHHYLETLLESKTHSDGRTVFCNDYSAAFERYIARIHVINSNKLSFVLKTAKTHRSIATEPMLNGFYQKGIDQILRRKLLKVGLDLSDQTLNQRLAREGSLNDSHDGYVTIDLRSASNSNAIGPAKYLYPPDWFSVLDRTRSHYLSYKGEEIRYNMLCSMGNGFCFPIETLTFAAICFACGCGQPGVDFSVYGDDIIVRKKYSTKVLAMLKHYGFAANVEKTFVEGPFRESCGSDWFNGEDVRPFTLDFAFDGLECFYKFLNLTQRSIRTSQFFEPVRSMMTHALPIEYQFFRPLHGEVDTGIDSLGDEHLSCPSCVFDKKTALWSWKELVQTPITDVNRLMTWGREPWLMGIALRGAKSVSFGYAKGLPDVTFRRKTRAKITRKSYSATSNWLPACCLSQAA
jgi:hypothetical protein